MWLPKIFNGKDKLFFMGNYESFRKRGNTTGLYSLAPAAVQGGDFSAIAGYNVRSRSPRLGGRRQNHHRDAFPRQHHSRQPHQPHLEEAPGVLSHSHLPGVINNYVQPRSRPQNRDQFVLRMDYVESSKSTWAGRYSWGDENESSPGSEPERHQAGHQSRTVHGLEHARVFAHRGHRNPLRIHALLQFGGHAAGLPAQRGG